MPSFFTNTTNASSFVGSSATHASSHTPANPTNTTIANVYDSASDLGYGVGRLLRGAFDVASSAWQTWWNPNPDTSQKEIAHQRHVMIYQKGLEECVIHLERVIANLRKNPRDPQSMERIKKVAAHYAHYVNPAPTQELKSYQQTYFQPIETQLAQLKNTSLRHTVQELLPVLLGQNLFAEKEALSPQPEQGINSHAWAPLSVLESMPAIKNKRAVMQQSLPIAFDLNTLNGTNGFMIPGIASDGALGISVSTAGDINGDNISDLVLGAETANSGNGAAYVIFGSRAGFVSPFNLNTLNGTNGFMIPGIASDGALGSSVSTAGDINGDNITDLVLGTYGANGTAYVIFGSRAGFVSPFNLTTLNGTNGFIVPAIASYYYLGNSVSAAGDINGDNITDLVLGTYGANSNNGEAYEATYVIFGSRGGFVSPFNLTTLNGTNGFIVPGIVSGGDLGSSVSTAGDINGDNMSDLILGAYGENSLNGAAYIIFGSRGGFVSPFNLTNLNGTNGFIVPGIALRGRLGISVSTAGDINGDNITDLVLGADDYATSGYGVAYVIFGSRNGFISPFNLTNLNGTNGFRVPGIASGGGLGSSVSTAGDINGDNITDIVLGAETANSGGTAYVIFGSRVGFVSPFNLTNLNGTNGFMVPGIASVGYLGSSVSTAGDINGDNITDLVLGAYAANSYNGTAYVIFGQNTVVVLSTPTPTPISSLTPCASGQPLMLGNHDIQINQGQNLRLSPNDLSASCGNNTPPNLGTDFTITGINYAQFKTRNSSGFWANASSFLGSDLSQGNVELIQDNSTYAPDINFTVSDGEANLTAAADVQFSTSESSVQVISIVFNIPSNGTIILSPPQFQINATGIKLDDVVISVASNQGGYFTTVIDPTSTIPDFTYYQVQTGQIQFIYNGTAVPNITLNVGAGSGLPVLVSPIVNLFETQTQNPGTIPKDVIIGSVVGAFALIAAGGLTAFGIFKYKEKRDHMVQQLGKAQAADYLTHPPKSMNS